MPGASSPSRFDPATLPDPACSPSERWYGLDIETDTSIDGLDPATSAVVAVAVSTSTSDTVLLGDEASILRRLDELLATLPTGLLITWNGASFDLPFLVMRAGLLGVPLGLQLWTDAAGASPDPALWPAPHGGYRAAWGRHGHLDGYRLYCSDVRRILGLSCGLKAMARLVGLRPVEVDRTQIHLLTQSEMTSYVASDARLARQLVERRLPAAAAFADRGPLPVSRAVTYLRR